MAKKREDQAPAVDANLRSPNLPVDPAIDEEFHAADVPARSGARQLSRKLSEHYPESPALTGGDIDAAWDSEGAGEEGPGGSVATPDQDVVDEIGAAVGLTFDDNEPVDGPGKVRRRDRARWELNPASSEDFEDRRRRPPPEVEGPEAG